MELGSLVNCSAYFGAAICVGLGALGSAIGEGRTAGMGLMAISQQPEYSKNIVKTMLIGQAVAETSGIFALVISVILVFVNFNNNGEPLLVSFALLSAAICMGVGAIFSGVGAGMPSSDAMRAIGNQPGIAPKVTTYMLIGQAICQTPVIFAMVVAFILMFRNFSNPEVVFPYIGALVAAGFCTGAGGAGSSFGGGQISAACCAGTGRNPRAAKQLFMAMLVGQAVSQTPALFAFLISVLLLFKNFGVATDGLIAFMAMLAAGISMGMGGIGSGVGGGIVGDKACEGISKNPLVSNLLTRTMLIGMAVTQSTAIYALMVSLVLIYVV